MICSCRVRVSLHLLGVGEARPLAIKETTTSILDFKLFIDIFFKDVF